MPDAKGVEPSQGSRGWWPDLVADGSFGTTVAHALCGGLERWDDWREIRQCNPLTMISADFRRKLLQERDAAWRDSRKKAAFLSYGRERADGGREHGPAHGGRLAAGMRVRRRGARSARSAETALLELRPDVSADRPAADAVRELLSARRPGGRGMTAGHRGKRWRR